MDWTTHYPNATPSQRVEIADVGCGFGGLLFALAPLHPNTLILGLEIRSSVADYVDTKIRALRSQHAANPRTTNQAEPDATSDIPVPSCDYTNISVLRANTMKFLPNLFTPSQLHSLFLCFPDPHFKSRKHKARIVSSTLTAEYAYVLRPGGKIYTITDVEDLHLWMVARFEESPSFELRGGGGGGG